jgi:DNA-binding Lrp family transcriptional regulator
MSLQMRLDDEIRLNILGALLEPNSVQPNIRQIQKHTGYHKATIKSSLDFFSREGLITGFGPKVDFKKFGYKLEVIALIQADLTKRAFLEKWLSEVKKDPNLYRVSGLVGSGNYNLISRHIYTDIESYHNEVNRKYFQKLAGIHDFMKRREVFYVTEPFYKISSRTGALIDIIRGEKGNGKKG